MTKRLEVIHLLVVEDESDTRELLRFLLELEGATVDIAENVPTALEIYKKRRPDVLVADIGMPDYNGYALIANIRKQEKAQNWTTPAIALTAFSTPADRDTALTSGFNAYLSKPFEPEELLRTIRLLYDEFHKGKAA
jgi:CheY-like chemotaxis protein